ncbi:MAG: GIY-YIG nuclease family protein [Candidatus Falkowbacteria bacterium]
MNWGSNPYPRVQDFFIFMGYQTYVLKSLSDGIRYIGSGESAEERLRRHNKGDYRFTKGHRPWTIIHIENYPTKSEALHREKFLKSGQGRKWLDEQGIK